jgi:hypothetical protein
VLGFRESLRSGKEQTMRRFVLIMIFVVIAGLACDLSLSSLASGVPSPATPTTASATMLPPPPAAKSDIPLCRDAEPHLPTDLQVRQPQPLAEPLAHAPFRDPLFGTCIVRVTDRKNDIAKDDRSKGLKNEYSRVQSFNADGSRLLVRGTNATWYVYDAATLRPLAQIPLEIDPRWDPNNPNVIYYSSETRLMSYNLQTQAQTLVHDFAKDFPGQSLAAVWSKYEGNPSRDGRYWGMMAEDQNWVTVAFVVYDLQTNQVIAKRDMRVPGVEEVDNAHVSPLGNYFIADFADHYCEQGQRGTDAKPCGYMVYDRNLKNGRV